jgi:hypothetical protein
MEGCVMLPKKSQSTFIGNMPHNGHVNLKPVGEPDTLKGVRPVREGAVGKVLRNQ